MIGTWKDHLPYKNAIALCDQNRQLLVATENALFVANKKDNKLAKIKQGARA